MYINHNGYVMVYAPQYPRAQSNGYVLEHIVVAEMAMRKSLPEGAEVHHVSDNRTDNQPQNLVVCQSKAYHALLHQRTDAIHATGDPNARKCSYCGTYENQADISIIKRPARPAGNGRSYHRACAARYVMHRRTA